MQPDRRRLLHEVITDATDRIVTHDTDIHAKTELIGLEIIVAGQSNSAFAGVII